jgi:hypothetical protein
VVTDVITKEIWPGSWATGFSSAEHTNFKCFTRVGTLVAGSQMKNKSRILGSGDSSGHPDYLIVAPAPMRQITKPRSVRRHR